MPSDLTSHITTHLKARFPNLSPANASKIAEKIAAEVASGTGNWMPDQDQVAGLAAKVQEANPAWFKVVPGVAELTEHLIAKNGVTSPTDRLRIAHEVQSLDADGRLALLGGEEIKTTQKAQELPVTKNEPTLQERCEAAALDFHGQSASARLSQARAIARGDAKGERPNEAAAMKGAGHTLSPVQRLKQARGVL